MEVIRYPHRVKARKKHVCDYCRKLISPGEEYECATCVCDGDIYNWRTCDRCLPYVNEAFLNKCYDWDDGMGENDFRDYMREEHREVAEKWWG